MPPTKSAKFNNVVSFLWEITDLLNGAFQKSGFQKIILPFPALNYGEFTSIKPLEFEKHESVPDSKTIEFDGIEINLTLPQHHE